MPAGGGAASDGHESFAHCPWNVDILTSQHHSIGMGAQIRTTLHIDADVYRAARSLAAAKGQGIGSVLSALARKGLAAPLPAEGPQRGFPTFAVPAHAEPITTEMVRSALEDE
ncbi:MAG TPA: hypothetical protein VF518_01675 [Polyangia bacterium]